MQLGFEEAKLLNANGVSFRSSFFPLLYPRFQKYITHVFAYSRQDIFSLLLS
jgi:hypothetical protein